VTNLDPHRLGAIRWTPKASSVRTQRSEHSGTEFARHVSHSRFTLDQINERIESSALFPCEERDHVSQECGCLNSRGTPYPLPLPSASGSVVDSPTTSEAERSGNRLYLSVVDHKTELGLVSILRSLIHDRALALNYGTEPSSSDVTA
jgi:hypothetical protein